jgi:hypothetical protein
MQADRFELSRRLRPVSPPRIVDDVLGDDQLAAVLDLMRRHGPWDLILKHHFASLEELIATTSGGAPADPKATLASFVTPTFRGFFANDGVCLYPEAEPILYDRKLMRWAREYWGAKYVRPMKILFNVNGPCWNLDPGHLDSPRFRGMGILNTPTWLLGVMGKSGLFKPWQIKLAEVITWFYRGKDGGGFTFWPDGPLAPPQRLPAPLWNRGVVVQNTAMLHRGESCGAPEERANPPGLTFDSTFSADPADHEGWRIQTGDAVIARLRTSELRLLVHWDAELYEDAADLRRNLDHLEDLTPERVFETLCADLRKHGVPFTPPSDPLRDPGFIGLLARSYDLAPSAYPPEAPVAAHAA